MQNLGALQVEVARLAFSRVARGPVLGLTFLAAVASFAAMAGVETGFGLRRAAMADITESPSVSRTSSVIIPVRPLTFDATILSEAASTTDSSKFQCFLTSTQTMLARCHSFTIELRLDLSVIRILVFSSLDAGQNRPRKELSKGSQT